MNPRRCALTLVLSLASAAASAQTAAPAAPAAPAQPLMGNPHAGQDKIAMCVGCHGLPDYKTTYPEVYRVPKIGGQNAQYISAALHEYQKGERTHPSMRAIAASLSEQDIADIAAYYSQLK